MNIKPALLAAILALPAFLLGVAPTATSECHPNSARCWQAAVEATASCAAEAGTDDITVTVQCSSHAWIGGAPAAIGAAQADTQATGLQAGADASLTIRVQRKGQDASASVNFTLVFNNQTSHLTFTSPTRMADRLDAGSQAPKELRLGLKLNQSVPTDNIVLQFVVWDDKGGFDHSAIGIKVLPAKAESWIPSIALLGALIVLATVAVLISLRRKA